MLAGGSGRRLGGINKSLIEIGGVTLIQRSLAILQPLFSEILISGWHANIMLPEGVIPVPDNFPGTGPLAGIEASMKAASLPYIFVFGGDMPWLSEKIITAQALNFLDDRPEVLVPRTGMMTEPLHAIYDCTLHSSLEKYLRSGGKPAVRDFIALSRVRYFDLPSTDEIMKAFTNINYPEDLPGNEA
ncbi:MAG: molybdenum cofactor guanylyltransferase [Bacteroidales bacterium]|nr:molybdenum cofactor guanylyltransferase [Bacteroidales bacterium]